ncbi:helix-turn-helix domain-containing protein [Maricaulis maris]|uniref:helix-turn-helix transcriptional regulator n=1 Tax=Maricaulis maris TaxID=74318 RepID=UPI003B8E00C9
MRRQKTLITGAGLDVRLTWYRPGEQMAPHTHGCHQISWLLCGELRETGGRHEHEVIRTSRGVKPAGFRHANVYGAGGALVLAVDMDPDGPACSDLPGPGDWSWAEASSDTPIEILQLSTALNAAGAGSAMTVSDITACALAPVLDPALDDPHARAVEGPVSPRWLERVREQLRDDPDEPDLASLADQAGVHRVHLSRSFRARFGLPPSRYRLRSRVSRAIADMVDGSDLADAAMSAGFADQSHFTRAVRAQTGFTPHHLRGLLAA